MQPDGVTPVKNSSRSIPWPRPPRSRGRQVVCRGPLVYQLLPQAVQRLHRPQRLPGPAIARLIFRLQLPKLLPHRRQRRRVVKAAQVKIYAVAAAQGRLRGVGRRRIADRQPGLLNQQRIQRIRVRRAQAQLTVRLQIGGSLGQAAHQRRLAAARPALEINAPPDPRIGHYGGEAVKKAPGRISAREIDDGHRQTSQKELILCYAVPLPRVRLFVCRMGP